MKKLKLQALQDGAGQVLSRAQLKNVIGGDGGSGGSGSGGTLKCRCVWGGIHGSWENYGSCGTGSATDQCETKISCQDANGTGTVEGKCE